MINRRIKVAIVDDSALIRQLLSEIFRAAGDMDVVGAVGDPYAARELIRNANPDVLTLDVEMPRMDGLEFLEKLMRLRPMPVVMVSTLTQQGSETALRALELGAVDVVGKPTLDIERSIRQYADTLCDTVRAAAEARVQARPTQFAPALNVDSVVKKAPARVMGSSEKLIVIGSSTGGTEAVRELLMALPADCPAVLVAQHMPPGFTQSFAARLDRCSRLTVVEASHRERILPGHAYIAPGHSHLLVARSGANYVADLNQGPAVNRHRPSVDVLFRSAANLAAQNAIGVILTGMGKDGAAGMKEMHDTGSWTIAQDEASCVVFGMPREAIATGGVDEILPLSKIAGALIARLRAMGSSNRV